MVSFLSDIYRETRYLQDAGNADLAARLDGLVANLVSFDCDGEPQLRVENGREAIAFIELIEEFKLRGYRTEPLLYSRLQNYEGLFSKGDIERIQIQLERFRGRKCLFKFTKAEYVDPLLNGAIRFKAASFYNDPNFSIGIRDDELNIEHNLVGLRMTTENGERIPVKGNRIIAQAAGDYYVSCFSSDFKLQFYRLFDCDSCVVIADSEKFVAEVIANHEDQYPDFLISFGRVEYIDRYRQLKSKRPIEFRKSWDYSYEKEYRFVSFREDNNKSLEPFQTVNIDATKIEYWTIRV
jgi:hypothetical protein